MKDRIIQTVMPRIYGFVKRHKRIRAWALRLWGALSRASAQVRNFFPGSKSMPAPSTYADTADWVNQNSGSTERAGEAPRITTVFPPEQLVRPLPGTIDGTVHWKFRANVRKDLAATFVAEIPNGHVYDQGFVITPDNVLLGDVSRQIVRNEYEKDTSCHPLLAVREIPPPRNVRGRVAVLATFSGRGFYHWMFDVLPRIGILRAAGMDLEKIDYFFVNECVASFHFATLEAAGIERKKLLQKQWYPHVRAGTLIVPSHVGELSSTPRWACDYLRKTLLPAGAGNGEKGPERIYIHRQNNTHRKVTNESDIVSLLRGFGFTIIDPETYSLPQQAAMFAQARVIVAPHGSGLANLVFCEPGAKVIEFFHPKAVSLMYWALCAELKLDYYYLLATGERSADGVDEFLLAEDIAINLDELRALLVLAGVLVGHVK